MSNLYQFGKTGNTDPKSPCPSPAIWAEVVTGVLPQDESFKYLEHAGMCPDCAAELQHAVFAVGETAVVPDDLAIQLRTASDEWQQKFAVKMASQEFSERSKRRHTSLPKQTKFRPFDSPLWGISAIAAIVVLAVGLAFFLKTHRSSPDTLIREAYAQQRTIEMRIPGAAYGPIQVERATTRSPISSPRPLLEAEVLIKGGLEKAPNDPELMRQKAEADLLTWNYQPAIETLNHALRIRPDSFPLLVDVATAYFERAEATSSPADYEAGLESLGDAIRLEPSNSAALFNRAILYERLFFYDRAIADWEQFLKLEHDPQWKAEAERRLEEIRSRRTQHSRNSIPDGLSPNRFQKEVTEGGPVAIEEYVGAAERSLLPNVTAPVSENENYAAVASLAQNLKSQHSDPFIADLLLSAGEDSLPEAAQLLSQSSIANHAGHFEKAHKDGSRAAALFREAGNSAGWLAALFEQSYALQFESQADACSELAEQAAIDAHKLGYAFLESQLLIENAICSNMSGQLGRAKQIVQRALAVAKDHGYQSLYLRGLTLLAVLESDAGEDSRAWSDVQEGLALYWKTGLPSVRAYSLYTVLDRIAERLGHANVQFAALSESMAFRTDNSDRIVEASGHAKTGAVALRLGDLTTAEDQFAEAQRIFAAEPQTDSVRWRELEARVNLARVQLLRGADTTRAAALLADASPEIHHLSNRYLEFLYYDTLADLKIHTGDDSAARQFLEHAISLTQKGVQSLSTEQEKRTWMEQHRRPYILMSSMLLDSGHAAESLAEWQRYRLAASPESSVLLASISEDWKSDRYPVNQLLHDTASHPFSNSSDSYVLTYAFRPRGLIIWVRHAGEVRAAQPNVSTRELQRTAENFIDECSRPDSDLADLRTDGRALYEHLIGPVRQWLPANGHLSIEPDGVLERIPMEALIDEAAAYIGEKYSITVALGLNAQDAEDAPLAPRSPRLLVVAAPTAPKGRPAPPPGAQAEAIRVAGYFNNTELLLGRDATLQQVEDELSASTVFHFAGHAVSERDGAALLLADGPWNPNTADWLSSHRLDHLQLAVFSACATARPSEISNSRNLVDDFLQAGAHNAVASRWNVDSIATADFFELFYRSALSGKSVAQAVQVAASAFRQSPERSHPYYWAAFAAFGRA